MLNNLLAARRAAQGAGEEGEAAGDISRPGSRPLHEGVHVFTPVLRLGIDGVRFDFVLHTQFFIPSTMTICRQLQFMEPLCRRITFSG